MIFNLNESWLHFWKILQQKGQKVQAGQLFLQEVYSSKTCIAIEKNEVDYFVDFAFCRLFL